MESVASKRGTKLARLGPTDLLRAVGLFRLSHHSEVTEGLFDGRLFVRWALLTLAALWCLSAESAQFFAVGNPAALRHEAVLAFNAFPDAAARQAHRPRSPTPGPTST
jgi:hypothetical protein